MAGQPLIRTAHPGIYKRGDRYVITYRVDGRAKKETVRTLKEARALRHARLADAERGEFSGLSKLTLHDYSRSWIGSYQGTGRRGFREETRSEYRALLEKYTLTYFSASMKVTDITPKHVADFIGWVTRQPNRSGGTLTDSSVANALKPLRACLATARREGLIRHNPAVEAVLPHRPRIEDDDNERRPLGLEQLELIRKLVDPEHLLLIDFAVRTGLRASEIIGLDGRHLHLQGARAHVKVRQRYRSGTLGPLKTKHARREVPLDDDLAARLRALGRGEREPVFQTRTGTRLHRDNVRNRIIRPAGVKANAPWAGWHTFRHTTASMLFAEGRNVVQVQRWLGHHSASFTLDTYVHLLEDDLGVPLVPGGNVGATQPLRALPNSPEDDAAADAA